MIGFKYHFIRYHKIVNNIHPKYNKDIYQVPLVEGLCSTSEFSFFNITPS